MTEHASTAINDSPDEAIIERQPLSTISPTELREFAAARLENIGPNIIRRLLTEAADTIEVLRNRDAAAQTLIGVLRYKAQQAGDPVGGPDYSLYRQYADLFPPIPKELGGPKNGSPEAQR